MAYRKGVLFALALMAVSPPLTAAELTRVDVALGDVSINKVPFLIAADNGIYAKYGLDVHQLITPGAAAAVRASGVNVPAEYISADISKAPVSVGGGAPMISGVGKNPDAPVRVIVSTTENIFRSHIIAKPGIKGFADLKGRRVGTAGAGSVPHYGMIVYARKVGWEPGKDITIVPGAENFESLKAGKVDAIMGSAMISAMAPEAGYVDAGNFATQNVPLAGSGVMMESKWLAANRDVAARFVKATIEATALMKKDKKVFNAALAKWFNVTDPKVQARMYPQVQDFPVKPYPSVEGVKGAMQVYDTPNMRMHKPEEFYDTSFIADLDKSGFLEHPLP